MRETEAMLPDHSVCAELPSALCPCSQAWARRTGLAAQPQLMKSAESHVVYVNALHDGAVYECVWSAAVDTVKLWPWNWSCCTVPADPPPRRNRPPNCELRFGVLPESVAPLT